MNINMNLVHYEVFKINIRGREYGKNAQQAFF